ncbi:MAG: PilZ domain-containing protein [Nitrospirae bacterium]|nr:PilZ domain-containing protein [Nitrospirota bacterium]
MSEHDEIKTREFTRNEVRMDVVVRASGHPHIQGRSRELSMNGLYVLTCEHLAADTPCHVTLVLSDGKTTIEANAHVACTEPAGMGIAFDEMEPESFQHLRKLVLFNAKDHDLVEHEIENHIGFKTRIR